MARRATSRVDARNLMQKEAGRPKRKLFVRLLEDEQMAQMREAVFKVLWETGLQIDDEDSRRDLFATGECREGREGRVHYGRDLVERALETAAKRVVLYDRCGNLKVDTAGESLSFSPGRNCVNFLDHRTQEIRPCTLDDIRSVGKVCDALDYIDAAASLGYPQDVPPEDEAMLTVRVLAEETGKPITFIGHDEIETEAMWAFLAGEVGGWDDMAEKPCGLDLTGPLSPLRIPDETCRRVRYAAERSVPVVCYPALFPGMSGPVTLAGAIVQACVESIGGIVLNQLARPGAPIMAGASILPMDMRRADLAYGSPEYALTGAASAQFLDYLGIPAWVGAGCSDAQVVDQQAAAEAGLNLLSAALSGTGFLHNLGMLAGGRTGSLEQLVLCNEIAASVCKFAAGVTVDAETIASDVIHRASPDNSFLMDQHTQDNYLSEMWMPEMFFRGSRENWQESGSPEMRDTVRARLEDILG